jgi:thioredoxin 1
MAATFTDANFDADVIKSEKLTVVDFWAPWCGPCLALGPTIEALATEYDGIANIGKINVDENPNVSMTYGITSIPCIIFIKNGEVVDKQVGAVPKAVIEKKIVQHLN